MEVAEPPSAIVKVARPLSLGVVAGCRRGRPAVRHLRSAVTTVARARLSALATVSGWALINDLTGIL